MTSPWELLPAPVPQTENPKLGYFYDKVAKHLIPTTVRIMNTGLPIDLEKVQELEKELDTVLLQVETTLASNSIVKRYLLERYSRIKQSYVEDRLSKCKTPEQLIKPFKHTDMNHRSYFMHCIGSTFKIPEQDDKLPTGIDKWPANKIKPLAKEQVVFKRLLAGELNESNNKFAKQAMELLATHKAEIYNKKYLHQAKTFEGVELPAFNAASPDQKHDILTGMLNHQSDKLTDSYVKYERECKISHRRNMPEPNPPKNKYSWNRDNMESVLKNSTDPAEQELLQALVDHSMGAIIKNNFIQAFYRYTVEGRLFGTYKLISAKTGRYTSSNP